MKKTVDEFSALASQGPNPAKWKTIACKFHEMGKCKKGDACPFIHPKHGEGEWPEISSGGGSNQNSTPSDNQWNDRGGNSWNDSGGNSWNESTGRGNTSAWSTDAPGVPPLPAWMQDGP